MNGTEHPDSAFAGLSASLSNAAIRLRQMGKKTIDFAGCCADAVRAIADVADEAGRCVSATGTIHDEAAATPSEVDRRRAAEAVKKVDAVLKKHQWPESQR